MYHWMTDAVIPAKGTYGGGFLEAFYAIYHLLRTIGWKPVWECDGEDAGTTHINDGSMEASGVGSWTGGGAGPPVVTKSSANPHMGSQCLSFSAQAASDYVVSDALLTMSNSQQYELIFWALNDNDTATFDVEVDTGTGSWTNLGTIPANPGGSWTKFHFSFTTHSSGVRYVRFVSIEKKILLVDSVFIFRSWFEYYGVDAEDLSATPDGVIQNNDEIASGSYSYQAGDVNKYICIFDPVNVGNTGCYKITSVAAGVATVDVRTSGVRNLTSATGLRWRLIDAANGPSGSTTATASERYAGWGLQSPHLTEWRLFARNNWYNTGGSYYSWCEFWSATFDMDFDVEEGQFIGLGSRTTLAIDEYVRGDVTSSNRFGLSGDILNRDCTSSRAYMMTDEDGTFVSIFLRHVGGTFANLNAFGLVGFSGTDDCHSLNESFLCLMAREVGVDNKSEVYFDGASQRFSSNGVQVGVGGLMYRCNVMVKGYTSGTTAYLDAAYRAVARANPFDGEEWLQLPRVARDYSGLEGDPSEKSLTDMGQWMGRGNITIGSTFSSDTRFSVGYGWFWEWPGFTPIA